MKQLISRGGARMGCVLTYYARTREGTKAEAKDAFTLEANVFTLVDAYEIYEIADWLVLHIKKC